MDSPLVETRSYPDRELSDRHGFHQLLLGLDGALELEAAGRLIHVTRAVLAPVASGDLHHYLAPGDNRVLVLDLPEAWCEALLLDGLFEGPARRLPEALMARGECLRKAKMGSPARPWPAGSSWRLKPAAVGWYRRGSSCSICYPPCAPTWHTPGVWPRWPAAATWPRPSSPASFVR